VFGGAGPDFDYGNFIFGTSEAETAQQVVFRFDVEVMSPDRWIDQASLHQDWYEGGFYSSDGFLALFSSEQDYWLETKLRDDSHGGANLLIDSSNYDVFQNTIVSADLRPTRRLSVETTAWMTGGAFLDSFVVDFNLVPEPSSLALAVCVFVAAGGCMVCTRLRGAVE
jgi:hypothetical protein